ncbi:MAG: imidazole glycerol phosphate synthase subunit HisH [Glaciecola sp.]
MIAIIDYGMGNLGSVNNVFKKNGYDAIVTRNEDEIRSASGIVLPGVGHFAMGMSKIHELGLFDLLNDVCLAQKKPTLGICLGMQLMTTHSEEGDVDGFNWISGSTKAIKSKLNPSTNTKIPYMGWDYFHSVTTNPFTQGIERSKFYYVHSYHVTCEDRMHATATCFNEFEYDVIIQRDNFYGAQFHPEKSHKHGFKLINNFMSVVND